MKKSTALFKQINFSKSNIRKLKKSIRHSLQLISKLHFNPDLVEDSWLYTSNGKQHLLKMSEEDREAIALEIIERVKQEWQQFKEENQREPDEAERLKITKTISKRRSDLKKEIQKDTYTDRQKKLVTQFLEQLKKPTKDQADNFHNKPVSQKAQDKLNEILGDTKAGKLTAKLIELHNAKLGKPPQDQKLFGRTTVMQESIFKLPIHNGVELPPDDFHNIVSSFLKKYFPDHKLELSFFHGNEKAEGEPSYNAHCHVFINGRNSKTGKYDLLERTREVANEYAKANGLDPIKKNLEDIQRVGEYRQQLFYAHAQEYLNKHNRQVELYFLPDTEERRKQRALIKKDAQKPKEDRFYNQLNYQLERLEKHQNSLKQKTEQAKKEVKKLFEDEKQELEESRKRIKNQMKINSRDKDENIKRSRELDQKEQQIKHFGSILDRLSVVFTNVSRWVGAVLRYQFKEASELHKTIKTDLEELTPDLQKQDEKRKDLINEMFIAARYEVEFVEGDISENSRLSKDLEATRKKMKR